MKKEIPVEAIVLKGMVELRGKPDPQAIMNYKMAYKKQEEVAPIVVFGSDSTYWIADGRHRVEGMKWAGVTMIEAEVKDGGEREAFLYSIPANHKDKNTRFSLEDRKRAAEIMLLDEEWGRWSYRKISRYCCSSPGIPQNARKKLVKEGRLPAKRIRIAEDSLGRTYKVETSDEVRSRRERDREKRKSTKRSKVTTCHGEGTGIQVVSLLEGIPKTDRKRKEGLKLVCEWLQSQNACQHQDCACACKIACVSKEESNDK